MKTKIGRPAIYNLELGKKICRAISISTSGLERICSENPDFPAPSVIYEWKIDYPAFAECYAQAKRNQADLLVEEINNISDDSSRDTVVNKHGEATCDKEWIARSRLRVDTRKWLAAKLIPRVYGENSKTETVVTIKHEDAIKELK